MTGDPQKAKVEPLRKTMPCPECRRPSVREHYPFCSDRCRRIDFFRWWDGRYSVSTSVDIAIDPESGEMLHNPDDDISTASESS